MFITAQFNQELGRFLLEVLDTSPKSVPSRLFDFFCSGFCLMLCFSSYTFLLLGWLFGFGCAFRCRYVRDIRRSMLEWR